MIKQRFPDVKMGIVCDTVNIPISNSYDENARNALPFGGLEKRKGAYMTGRGQKSLCRNER